MLHSIHEVSGKSGEVRENNVEDREGGGGRGGNIAEWGEEMQNREGRENNRIEARVRVESEENKVKSEENYEEGREEKKLKIEKMGEVLNGVTEIVRSQKGRKNQLFTTSKCLVSQPAAKTPTGMVRSYEYAMESKRYELRVPTVLRYAGWPLC